MVIGLFYFLKAKVVLVTFAFAVFIYPLSALLVLVYSGTRNKRLNGNFLISLLVNHGQQHGSFRSALPYPLHL